MKRDDGSIGVGQRLRGSLLWVGALGLSYIALAMVFESSRQDLSSLASTWSVLPVICGLSLLSYLFRHLRWTRLLKTHTCLRSLRGVAAYLSGFALTATPGKAGELLRVRYHLPLGVKSDEVIGAFLFERMMDLVVILGLASLAAFDAHSTWLAVGFALAIIGSVVLLSLLARPAQTPSKDASLWQRSQHLLLSGLSLCRRWFNWRDVAMSLALGLVAWGLTVLAFILLIEHVGIEMAWLKAVAVYPFAMLVGAASMLPGGLGSTEASIINILKDQAATVALATTVALMIRIGTLWFSIACGMAAVLWLERQNTSPQNLD